MKAIIKSNLLSIILSAGLFISLAAAVTFAFLYFNERNRNDGDISTPPASPVESISNPATNEPNEPTATPTPTPSPTPTPTPAPATPLTRDNIDMREHSDDELREMLSLRATALREKINTRADAIAFLNMKFPELWMSYHMWQGMDSDTAILATAATFLNNEATDATGVQHAGRSDIITMMVHLLGDNCRIGGLYGFWADDFGDLMPIKAINYIYLDNEYIIFDPVNGMDGDQGSRYGELFPEMIVSSLEEYIEIVEASALGVEVGSIFALESSEGMTFQVADGWVTVLSPDISPIYINDAVDMTNPETLARLFGHIIPENISNYKLPTLLGGLTLSVDDAKALVGQSPERIQQSVKTAGDMLLYMLAAQIRLKSGCLCTFADGHVWHHNEDARTVLRTYLGNCGSMANLANFLLKDDYEEIGFIIHSNYPGSGGGHVYNYIKHQGNYYIVDFSGYLFSNYSVSSEFNTISMNRLEDFGTRWSESFGGIAAIIAHTSPGMHIPNIFGEDSGQPGIVYYPDDAEFIILFETPGTGIEIRTLPVPAIIPNWRIAQ